MRKCLAVLALALVSMSAYAQPPVNANRPFVEQAAIATGAPGQPAVPVSSSNPLPVSSAVAAAVSTPLTGTATTTQNVGPFTPQLGRSIRFTARLTAGTSYSAQVFTSTDNCTTRTQLTLGGSVWGQYSSVTYDLNEDVDLPNLSGVVYCLNVTPGSGATIAYSLRQ